jgi:hypothetical protein
MVVDGCLAVHIQVAVGPGVEAQEQVAGGRSGAVVAETGRLAEAAVGKAGRLAKAAVEEAAATAGCEVGAGKQRVEGQSWTFEEPCVDCICYLALETGRVGAPERHCIVGGHFGTAAGACSSGSQVEAENSLSEADACCSGREALHKLRPCYGCMLLEVVQRWTMLSLIVIA